MQLSKTYELNPRGEKSFPALKRSSSNPKQRPDIDLIAPPVNKEYRELELMMQNKNREIAKLENMNKQLVMGQQKRDEIIASALEENRKLKENIRWYQRLLNQTKKQMKAAEISMPSKSKQNYQDYQPKQEKRSERKNTHNLIQQTTNYMESEDNIAKRKIIDNLLDDYDTFSEKLNAMDNSTRNEIFTYIKEQKKEYEKLLGLTMRLKKLISGSHQISISLVLDEAIETLVHETCENLICDRASVFLVDELNGELWTKAAKGTNKTIRIPMDKGIVGYVAMSGNRLNIEDAYKDSRFNKAVDIQTSYRTKTILAIPIKDPAGNIIGVAEAINKVDGIFTPDDEALFDLLSAQAGIMLRNSMRNEISMLMLHKMRLVLETCILITEAKNIIKVLEISEERSKELMSTDVAKIYLVKEGNLIRYANGEEEKFSCSIGLVGKCAKEKVILNIPDAYNDPSYNGIVDIDSTLPVLCFPILNHDEDTIAVLEILNNRGVYGRASSNRAKLNQVDNEIFQYFEKILALNLNRFS